MTGADPAGPPDGAPVGLDLDDMRLLVVLAEELHFGRAALRLHLSQPGLSYRVKRMEDALGYALLARSRRRVELTAAGAAVVEGARRLLAEARRLVDDGARLARGETATLRTGFVGTALYGLLPPVLRELRRRHPHLRLLLEERKTAASVRALQHGELDVALVHLPLDPGAGLATAAATTEPVGLALPADHPLAGASRVELAQFARDPFVLFDRALEPQTHDRYVQACVDAGFAPLVEHRGTGLQTVLGLVAAGMGVAFVSASVAAHSSRSGVVFRPLDGPAPTLTTGCAWREPVDGPAVLLLRDVVSRVAGQVSGPTTSSSC
jgi:DNA-binding transcriptional LysR family regulator